MKIYQVTFASGGFGHAVHFRNLDEAKKHQAYLEREELDETDLWSCETHKYEFKPDKDGIIQAMDFMCAMKARDTE